MLFNSLIFIAFLVVVFLLYWLTPTAQKGKNLILIFASGFFYAWWDWRFLGLLAITVVSTYASGIIIGGTENSRLRKWVCAGNLILNIGILCLFKYYDFFATNFAALLNLVGFNVDAITLNLILPIGISFYTFQALGYTIDVYKNKIDAHRDFIAFTLFITFFPQLLAGPIERASNMLPQYGRQRSFDYPMAVDGCRQMLWGYFKKMVIADRCAMVVNPLFATYHQENGFLLLIGAFLYTIQIYCDFSGYSDISIGVARLFGIKIGKNFDYPYFSRSIPEFWRRWHMSLMRWFRDYIYFPLGGSRCNLPRIAFNTYVVFLVSGLWHGANWTFIFWGAYHATLILAYRILGINTKDKEIVAHNSSLPTIKDVFNIVVTFVLAMIGWVFFRADTIADAFLYIKSMFDIGSWSFSLSYPGLFFALLFLVPLAIAEWMKRRCDHVLCFTSGSTIATSKALRWTLYVVLMVITIVFQGTQGEFIYFQF